MALENNTLSGKFPHLNARKLEFVDVSMNHISGTIPESLFSSDNLEFVYLSNNNLSGRIPGNYTNAQNLKDLWLDNNDLTGAIPVSLGNLTSITEILLDGNRLNGPVPDGLCALRSLYPEQFTTLRADCQPTTKIEVAFNFCRIGCCTECTTGKYGNETRSG